MSSIGLYQKIAYFFVATTLSASVALSNEGAWVKYVPIVDFHEVTEGFYRGARPGHEGMAALAAMGVKTDINLDDDQDVIEDEGQQAKLYGMRYFSRPLSGFFAPSDESVNDVLNVLADRSNYPVFIHCQYGHDRTGLLVGLYRVFQQGWTPGDAYDEMRELGFHWQLLGLQYYFVKRTHSHRIGSGFSEKFQ